MKVKTASNQTKLISTVWHLKVRWAFNNTQHLMLFERSGSRKENHFGFMLQGISCGRVYWSIVLGQEDSWDFIFSFFFLHVVELQLVVITEENKLCNHVHLVCVWIWMKIINYFTIQFIFAIIYGSHCIFWYYLWVLLYYFN